MRYPTRPLLSFLLAAALPLHAAERSPGDLRLLAEVESALIGYEGSGFSVDTRRGVVQIAGFVTSMQARQEAADTVSTVPGVEHVSNKLVVLTSVRSAHQKVLDNLVAGKIKAGLSQHEAVGAFDITVDVHEGIVLLSGFVDTVEERETAESVAGEIDGVQRVINGLDVVPADENAGGPGGGG